MRWLRRRRQVVHCQRCGLELPPIEDLDAWNAVPRCVDGYGHMAIDPRLLSSVAPEHRQRLGLGGHDDAEQPPNTPADRYAYALETQRLAETLWAYIFPPWRWREWNRRRREVDRRLSVLTRPR